MDKSIIKLYLGKCLKEFINAILAGLMISFGAMVFLFCSAMGLKILGCFMFIIYSIKSVIGIINYVRISKDMKIINF